MKLFLILLIIVAVSLAAGTSLAQSKTRILFIGNSLTYVNDLPGLVAALADERGLKVEWEMAARGGYRFSQHVASPDTLKKIKAGNWDYVVLQEQSQLPAFSRAQVKRDVFPYAKKLCAAIRATSPWVNIVFYETMAEKNGGMQTKLNQSYSDMAKANKAALAPVGELWADVRADRPALDLYADDTHPNLTGSYLVALVIYTTIFKQRPLGLSHPPEIDNYTAAYLQEMVDRGGVIIHRR